MPYFNYNCDSCGDGFETLIQTDAAGRQETAQCPACGSGQVSRQVGTRIAVRTAASQRGRVIDMSSGACPCGGHGHTHH